MADLEFFTTDEVAKILRVHRTTVQRMIECGQLPGSLAIQTGKRKFWRVPKTAIERLAKQSRHTTNTKPPTDLVQDPYPNLSRFAKSVR